MSEDCTRPTSLSLCSGAFGIDLGFMRLGGAVRVATDISKHSETVARANVPDVPFVLGDICDIETDELLEVAGLDVGEATFVYGGPPCQPFTILGKRKGLSDPRSEPLREFFRVVREARPRFFLMEEVTGIKRKTEVWDYVVRVAGETGYRFTWMSVQAADYGVPQKRNRIFFFGSRDGSPPKFPAPTHMDRLASSAQSSLFGGGKNPWATLRDAVWDLHGTDMSCCPLPPQAREALPLVPEGGNWRDLPVHMQEELMGPALNSDGGKAGFFRRLSWDEPSPTVLTRPVHKMTFLGHPTELRALSVEECRRIQTFPDDWEFPVPQSEQYRLIGNAVPPFLAEKLFSAFLCHKRRHRETLESVTLRQREVRRLDERLKMKTIPDLRSRRQATLDHFGV